MGASPRRLRESAHHALPRFDQRPSLRSCCRHLSMLSSGTMPSVSCSTMYHCVPAPLSQRGRNSFHGTSPSPTTTLALVLEHSFRCTVNARPGYFLISFTGSPPPCMELAVSSCRTTSLFVLSARISHALTPLSLGF